MLSGRKNYASICSREPQAVSWWLFGGAIAVYTVAHSPYKDRVKALILDSPLASYRMIAREKIAGSIIGWPLQYPLSWLVNDDYSPLKCIKDVAPAPLLILHGERDRVVPLHHGRLLYDAAAAPKEFRQTTPRGHVRSFADANVRERLIRYLSSLFDEQ